MQKIIIKDISAWFIVLSMLGYAIRGNLGAIFITIYISLIVIWGGINKKISLCIDNGLVVLFLLLYAILGQLIRGKEFHYYLIIGYMAAIIVLCNKELNVKLLLSLLKKAALFESIGIYIQFLAPNVYYSIISIILPGSVVEKIKNRLVSGYYTGFSREVSYTMFFIVVGLGLFLYEDFKNNKVKQTKWMRVFCISFLFSALLISGKRAPLFLFFTTVFIIQFIKSNNQLKILKYLGVVFAFLIGIILTYPIWRNIHSLQRIVELLAFAESKDWIGITNGRTVIYKLAIDLWKENIWIGIGWGNFKYMTPANTWYSRFDVHNCFLQVLCENGIIGACFYYGIILFVIVNLVKCINKFKHTEDNIARTYGIIAAYIQLFFILYSITEPILYEYTDYLLFFIGIKITGLTLKNNQTSLSVNREGIKV